MNYRKTIEDAVVATLLSAAPTYTASRMYGAISPDAIVDYIFDKLSAGVPAYLVRVADVSSVPIDTEGMTNRVDVNIEVVCAANIIKETEIPGVDRLTDVMMNTARSILVKTPVAVENNPARHMRYSGESDLFYAQSGDAEAQLLRLRLEGIIIDLS